MISRMTWRQSLMVPVVVMLAGCWAQPGYDAGHSNASPLPTPITPASVGSLVRAFGAPSGPNFGVANAVVANGTLFTSARRLHAFDAGGTANCSGSPLECAPLWQSDATDPDLAAMAPTPAVGGGKVWGLFQYSAIGTKLLAYDAAGVTNCSGIPKTCKPVVDVTPQTAPYFGLRLTLGAEGPYVNSASVSRNIERHSITAYDNGGAYRWTSGVEVSRGPIVVGNGFVFASLPSGQVAAFDATGQNQCAPSNGFVFCNPVWTTTGAPAVVGNFPSTPVVRDGHVFVHNNGTAVAVFDASGNNGCGGVPKTCAPQWTTSAADTFGIAVTGDRLVTSGPSGVRAFALNSNGCSSSIPAVCSPTWTGTVPNGTTSTEAPTVAGGVVYAAYTASVTGVVAYDLAGSLGCSGVPKTCNSLWSPVTANRVQSPIVVGPRLYLADAAGQASEVTAFKLP